MRAGAYRARRLVGGAYRASPRARQGRGRMGQGWAVRA